jgi:hypothetical protein
MELGPVELVVLTFPGERADPDVVQRWLRSYLRDM